MAAAVWQQRQTTADGSSGAKPAGGDQSEGRAACSRAAAIRVAAPAVTEDERLTASTK